MRAALIFLAVFVVVAAVVVVFLSWDRPLSRRTNPETTDAYIEGDTRPLSARVGGYVRRLPIADNQAVRAGDVIAELVDDDYRARADQAAAAVVMARAALDALDRQRTTAELQVGEAATQVTGRQATLTRDRLEEQRQLTLLPTDIGVLRDAQQAVAARRQTQASVGAARSVVEERRRAIDLLAAQRLAAEADLALRQAQLAEARLQLGYTVVRAPQGGVVGARQVRAGSLLAPGQEIVSLTPLDTVWVTANFSERQITSMAPGQRARIRVDSFPGHEIAGRVLALAPATGAQFSGVTPDNLTGNYTKVVQRLPVKVVLDRDADPLLGLLRPGMSTEVRVITDAAASGQTARPLR